MNTRIFLIIGLIVLLASFNCFAGPKIDTVYFQSGDRITGEFKGMENNLVKFSTLDASTIEVKWDRIDSLHVKHFLRIELSDGELLVGIIKPTDSVGIDAVFGGFGVRIVNHGDIVRIASYNKDFVDRLDGSVSAGVSYTKATELFKYDFSGMVKYTAERYIFESNYNGSFQKQPEKEASERHDINLKTIRLLQNKWFYSANLSSERNSELGLNLRANLGLSFGNNLVFTNYSLLYASAGSQINREYGVDTVANNAEAVLSVRFSVFKYRFPKLSLSIAADTYPSLTTPGRIRFQTDSYVRWEVFSDFYLKYSLYYTFDNQPLSATASHEDFSSSVGIEFTF